MINSNMTFAAETPFGIFILYIPILFFLGKVLLPTFIEYEIYVSQHHWCLKSSLSVRLHLQRGACSFSSPLSFGLVMIPGMSINSKSGTCLPNPPRRPECKSKSAKWQMPTCKGRLMIENSQTHVLAFHPQIKLAEWMEIPRTLSRLISLESCFSHVLITCPLEHVSLPGPASK